jgi:hypothetical protein
LLTVRSSRPFLSPTGLLGRVVAGGAAALVLLLAVLSASPTMHAWLHSQAAAQAQVGHLDDDCVVTQFSHGLLATTAALALVATLRPICGLVRSCAVEPAPPPRFWLPPLCGPPTT